MVADESPAIQSAFTPRTESRHAKFSIDTDSSPSDKSEQLSRPIRGDRVHTPATTLGGTFDSEDDFGPKEDGGLGEEDDFGDENNDQADDGSEDNDF